MTQQLNGNGLNRERGRRSMRHYMNWERQPSKAMFNSRDDSRMDLSWFTSTHSGELVDIRGAVTIETLKDEHVWSARLQTGRAVMPVFSIRSHRGT